MDILILSAILIPIYYTTGDRKGSNEQRYLIRSLGILFGSALTLLAIGMPKILSINRHIKNQQQQEGEDRTTTNSYTTNTADSNDSEDDRVAFYSDNVIRKSSNASQPSDNK